MNSLIKSADKIIVINLKHRMDRLNNVKEELKKIKIFNFEVFEAYGIHSTNIPQNYIKKTNIANFEMSGWFGNKFSHYGVIDLAKMNGWKSVLIFEDDVKFYSNFDSICSLAAEQLIGVNWDLLSFGINHRFFGFDEKEYPAVKDGLLPFKTNLSRIYRGLCLHAYLIKNTMYDFILENALQSSRSIDNFYAYEVYRRYKCYTIDNNCKYIDSCTKKTFYCCRKAIATQTPCYNDIGQCYSDYEEYID